MRDDALAVAALERVERGVVLGPGQRPDALPLLVAHQQLLGLARGVDEGRDQLGVLLAEALGEDVAELRRHALDAELGDRLLDADQLPEALGLEPRGEMPVVEHRIELAVLRPSR